jgi:hypothetical protein
MSCQIWGRRRPVWALIALIVVGAGLVGCASYTDQTRQIRQSFRAHKYEEALKKIEGSALKTQERNRLLFLLEKAMILDRMDQLAGSRRLLLQADQLVDELFTTSVSKEAATYVYNESAQDYPGEDYEKVAVHTMLALSFLDEGQLAEAVVEARAINTKLNEINSFYKEKKNRYGEDAFARYLAAMIHEAQGNWDSAIIDYGRALAAYEGDYEKFFATPVPADLVAARYRLLKKRGRSEEARRLAQQYPRFVRQLGELGANGELVVIYELGTIATKQRHEHLIPWGDEVLRFSFPVIRPRSPQRFSRTGVRVANRPFVAAQLVQNMDQIAAETLEDRRLRITLKQGARLIMKSQISQQAEKEFGPVAGLAAKVFGVVTETADTRSWTLLPSAFYVTRYQLPPGTHTIEIWADGKVQTIQDVKVRRGEMQFLRVHNS